MDGSRKQVQRKHFPKCRLRPPKLGSQQNAGSEVAAQGPLFKDLDSPRPGDWSGSRCPELQVRTESGQAVQ